MADSIPVSSQRLRIEVSTEREKEVAGSRRESRPDLEGRWIGMSYLGRGIAIIQRLMTSAIEQEDLTDTPLADLGRKERARLVQLGVTEVSNHSVILDAVFRFLQDPFVQTQLLTTVTTINTTITTLLITGVFDKARQARSGENPFKPNDATRTQLEALAAVARTGKLVFTIELGKEVCVIDAKTAEELKKLRKREKGKRDEFMGRVVGSSRRRHFVEIAVDNFGADIPCVYKQRDEAMFWPLTQIDTPVKLKGVPIWEGRDMNVGPPSLIELDWLRNALAPVPNSPNQTQLFTSGA